MRSHLRPLPIVRTTRRGGVLNDVHSLLNPTRVEGVQAPRTLAELRAVVRRAARDRRVLSIGGGLHAMGGQQFAEGSLHLDLRGLARPLALDRERGLLHLEAGIEWPELIGACLRLQQDDERRGGATWGIVQKQTGADRLTLGGAIAANGHGRGLTRPPISADVESLTLVDARGELVRCGREENRELFALARGGYGLFGVVSEVVLRLKRRQRVRRRVELVHARDLVERFTAGIARGATYGDFQFEIDEGSPTFLTRGVLSCYEPTDAPIQDGQRELTRSDWMELLELAHADKSRAFERYARHYAATDGQVYWDDLQQLGGYPEGYHPELDRRLHARRAGGDHARVAGGDHARLAGGDHARLAGGDHARLAGGEMISELYVPRARLAGFLEAAAAQLRAARASVVYGTVRLIERDDETLLAWAREPFACVVVNLHVDHEPAAIERAKAAFRGLIDLAAERGGSFFLTYHRWATREQLLACHPRLPEFLRWKRRIDPHELFQSEWYRHVTRLVEGGPNRGCT